MSTGYCIFGLHELSHNGVSTAQIKTWWMSCRRLQLLRQGQRPRQGLEVLTLFDCEEMCPVFGEGMWKGFCVCVSVCVWRLSLVNGGLTIKSRSVCIKHTLLSINRTLSVFLCSLQKAAANNRLVVAPLCRHGSRTEAFSLLVCSWKTLFQFPGLSWFQSCCRMRTYPG